MAEFKSRLLVIGVKAKGLNQLDFNTQCWMRTSSFELSRKTAGEKNQNLILLLNKDISGRDDLPFPFQC